MSDEEVVGTAIIRVVVDRTGTDEEIDQAVRDAEAKLKLGGERGGTAYGDAFGRRVRDRVAAAVKNLPDARLSLDDTEANRKLIGIRTALASLTDTRLGVMLSDEDVYAKVAALKLELESLTKDKDIRVRVDAAAALAELTALDKALGNVSDAPKKAEKEFGLLRNAIEQLLPPLVVLGGAALGISSSVVGLGSAGLLAFKGISDELKTGKGDAAAYKAGIGELKTGLVSLEATASHGVLTGFQQAIAKLNTGLPEVNSEIAISSKNLGDVTQHLVGGLIGGFRTFGPLIHEAEQDVDKLASKFEVWATGPGGAKFAQTLATDMREAGPAIGSLATGAAHLVSALQPIGGVMLGDLKIFGDVVKAIPVPVLQAAATAYIAFRTATLVSTGLEATVGWIGKLTIGLDAEAVAATRAAEATAALGAANAAGAAGGAGAAANATRFAGAAAFLTTKVIPLAAAWVGGTIALDGLSKSLGDTAHQMSQTKAVVQGGLDFAKDVLTFNFGHISDDFGLPKAQAQFESNWKTMVGQVKYALGGGAELKKIVSDAMNMSTDQGFFGIGQTGPDVTVSRVGAQVIKAYDYSSKNISAAIVQARATVVSAQKDYDQSLSASGDGSSQTAADAKQRLDAAKVNLTSLQQGLVDLAAIQKKTADDKRYFDSIDHQVTDATNKAVVSSLNTAAQEPTYAKSITDLTNLATASEKAADAQAKYNAIQIDANGNVTGGDKAMELYRSTVKSFGNDVVSATAFIKDQQTAYVANTKAVALSNVESAKLSTMTTNTSVALNLTTAQVDLYGNAMGDTAAKLLDGSVNQAQFTSDVLKGKDAISNGSLQLIDFVNALSDFDGQLDTVGSRATLMQHAFVDLQGGALGYANTVLQAASADKQLVQAFQANHKGAIDLKTGLLDLKNAAAVPIAGALQQLQSSAAAAAAATYQFEYNTLGAKKATEDANAVFKNDTYNTLIAQHKQLGITADEAKRLADNYFAMPPDATTDINAIGMDQVNNTLKDILADLDAFVGDHHGSLTLDAHVNISQSDRLLINQANSKTNDRNSIGSANGNVIDYYANGGVRRESHIAQIAPAGSTTRVWNEPETQGEGYVPFATSKRPRSRMITKEIAKRLGGVAHFDSGGFTGGFDTTDYSKSGSGSGSGSGGLSVSALDAFLKSLPGTLASIENAEATLNKAVSTAGGSSSLASYLKKEDDKLNAEIKVRDQLAAELAKAQAHYNTVLQEYHQVETSVVSAIKGGFDITSAGHPVSGTGPVTFDSIYAQQKQAAAKVTILVAGLKKLRDEGLNGEYVAQLAAKGIDALPEVTALLAATPKQLGLLNATASTIGTQANAGAYYAATAEYGGALATARALITGIGSDKNLAASVTALATQLFGAGKFVTSGLTNGISSQKAAAVAAAGNIAKAIVAEIKSVLDVHSPSRVAFGIGENVPVGLGDGMVSKLDYVQRSSNKLAGAAIPSLGGSVVHSQASSASAGGADLISQLSAMLEAYSRRPIILTSNGNQLAIAVGEQNQRLARLG